MSNQVNLFVQADWKHPRPTMPIFVQATQAGDYLQKVTITCESLGYNKVATSTSGAQFGTQFLNDLLVVENVKAGSSWEFDVTCQFSKDGGVTWQDSDVVAQNSVQLSKYGYMTLALSNDKGGDEDYNDTVVMISIYNQSSD